MARIIPEAHRRQREIGEALADIKELGKEIGSKHGPVNVEEIISSIREGHKY